MQRSKVECVDNKVESLTANLHSNETEIPDLVDSTAGTTTTTDADPINSDADPDANTRHEDERNGSAQRKADDRTEPPFTKRS